MKPLEPPKYPETDPFTDVVWAYNGFWRLSGARPIGMDGHCRIPFAEVYAWCELNRFGPEKSLEFARYVAAMDIAYMDFFRERREEEEGKRRSAAQTTGKKPAVRTAPPPHRMPAGARQPQR